MTTLAEIKVVTADECDCEFKDHPIAHDRLLAIEGMAVPYAAQLVADLISSIDPGTGEGHLFNEAEEFGRFVAQHNWADPVGMAHLAESVDWASNQAWQYRAEHTNGYGG